MSVCFESKHHCTCLHIYILRFAVLVAERSAGGVFAFLSFSTINNIQRKDSRLANINPYMCAHVYFHVTVGGEVTVL